MSPISSNLVWINYNSVATTYTQFSNTYYKYRFPVSMVTMQVWSQVNKVISPLPKCRSSTSIHNTKEPRQLHRKSGTRLVSRTRKIYRRFGGRKWAQRLTLLRFSIKRDGWSNRSFQILHSKNNVACFLLLKSNLIISDGLNLESILENVEFVYMRCQLN